MNSDMSQHIKSGDLPIENFQLKVHGQHASSVKRSNPSIKSPVYSISGCLQAECKLTMILSVFTNVFIFV